MTKLSLPQQSEQTRKGTHPQGVAAKEKTLPSYGMMVGDYTEVCFLQHWMCEELKESIIRFPYSLYGNRYASTSCVRIRVFAKS